MAGDRLTVLRSTPCIGICSTTYGDLVCRGCKRFSHEIVGWNSFDDDQRDRVWRRLQELRDGCTGEWVRVRDPDRIRACISSLKIPVWQASSDLALAYELLWRDRGLERDREGWGALEAAGVARLARAMPLGVAEVRRAIDAEFLTRSKATYEYSFKVSSGA